MGCCGKGPYVEHIDSDGPDGADYERREYTVSMEQIDDLRNKAAYLLEKRNKTPLENVRRAYQKRCNELNLQVERMLRTYRKEHGL